MQLASVLAVSFAVALLATLVPGEARDIVWGQMYGQVSRSSKLELLPVKHKGANAESKVEQSASAPAPELIAILPPSTPQIDIPSPPAPVAPTPPLIAVAPTPPSPSSASITTLTNCPTDPLEYCNFYFEGFPSSVPLLQLPPLGTNDVPISPAIRDSLRNASDPLGYIEVDSTNPGKFLCPAPSGTTQDGTNSQLGNSFYITNGNNGSSVFVRNLQNLGNDTILENRCVLLAITSAQVFPQGSSIVFNLNSGDGNSAYPEARRCVVFQTGPEATFCQPVAPSPAPIAAPPTSCPACPSSPTDSCDFVFQGFESQIPSFNLANVSSDQPFTPSVEYSANNITVVVEIDSTGPVCTPVNPEDSIFYGVNDKINARTFQSGPGAYAGGCYRVPLNSLAIILPGTNSPVNVNIGDNNQAFPEDRRCVWFKAV